MEVEEAMEASSISSYVVEQISMLCHKILKTLLRRLPFNLGAFLLV